MAAWEVLGCLCNGGTLILRGSDWRQALQNIDVLICTPSILAKYEPAEFPNISVSATAGEPSSQRLADKWANGKTYYNCCGPTETTIVNTMHKHQPGMPLSIGKPTPNNNVYILDEHMQLVDAGEAGVMWAGGLGVSRGYVDLPDVTAVKYKLDPFAADGSFMYDTGDLGRWTQDGSIEILGRVDDQVKVKGFRVELDGVAASLNACAGVDKACVLLIQDEIHAFVTPSFCNVSLLKEHLRSRQPYYAVPSQFHPLSSLPLTANGKTDKKALRAFIKESIEEIIIEKDKTINTSTTVVTIHSTASSSTISAHQLSESDVSSSDLSSSSSFSLSDEKPAAIDLEAGVPDKVLSKHRRGLRHRVFIVYRRLFSFVGLLNIVAAVALLLTGIQRSWIANMTAVNLVLAVLVRQDNVINVLYTICSSVPRSWPLWIRSRTARIIHVGGIHSGAAVSAALWLLATNVSDVVCMFTDTCESGGWGKQSIASKVISWILTALFTVMLVMAYPTIRKQHHDWFEKTHRFVGWTMLGLFWVQVVLGANDSRDDTMTLGDACLQSPSIWLLVVATLSIASSWFWLRKVPVDAQVLSDHAIRLHFRNWMPVNGTATRVSRQPLLEWHAFATIPSPEAVDGRPPGHSLVVSNAGDWTKHCIQNPPTHLWVRGLPACGVMRIATLFRRVVLVATGSGIGPLLGHIQNPSCPTQLIWSTPWPEKTFGQELCDTIHRQVPGAIIHNTKTLGRPDLVKMAWNMAKGFNAEAVIIIANEKITKKVVYGLQTRGLPAYGAIWDS